MQKFIRPTKERIDMVKAAMRREKSYLGFLNKGVLLNDMALMALTKGETVTFVTGPKGATYQIKITPLDVSNVPKVKSC